MSSLVETTSIEIKDLPDAVQDSLAEGTASKTRMKCIVPSRITANKLVDDANTKAVKERRRLVWRNAHNRNNNVNNKFGEVGRIGKSR